MKTYSRSAIVCLLVLGLLVTACGPGQLFGPTLTPVPTATPTATPTPTPKPGPVSGKWTGSTNEGHVVTFEISASGDELNKFSIAEIEFETSACGGVTTGMVTQAMEGPFPISDEWVSFTSDILSFTGSFTSTTSASGTYEFGKITIKSVGPPPAYLLKDCTFEFSQSGTWTAAAP